MTSTEKLLDSLRLSERPSLDDVLDRRASSLFVGVELEFIVLNGNLPARREDYYRVLQRLSEIWDSSKILEVDGLPTLRRTSSEEIQIEFKPDFSFNIFEISIGKAYFSEICESLRAVVPDVLQAIAYSGLSVHPGSSKKFPLRQIDLAPWRHLKGYLDQFSSEEKVIGSSWYPAEIAASQVHLDVLTSDYFEFAVFLFLQEFIFSENFTFGNSFNSSDPRSQSRHDEYEIGLGESYILKTVPNAIYRNEREYVEMLERCPKIFKSEEGEISKDLSFVRPRGFGSIEFRSACTNSDIEIIEQMIVARIAQFLTAVRLVKDPISKLNSLGYLPRKFWLHVRGQSLLSRDEIEVMSHVEKEFYEVLKRVMGELSFKNSRRRMSRIAA